MRQNLFGIGPNSGSLWHVNRDGRGIRLQKIFTVSHTLMTKQKQELLNCAKKTSLSGVPDFFDRNKILSGGDLSHYQVPHCIRVFFYFVRFVFIHHNFKFYFESCTYCNILDIYLS